MKLKDLLAVVDDEEYLTLYVIGEDFYVEDKDGFEIFDKTDKAIKPYLGYRITSITTVTDLFERPFIQIDIAKENV